MPEQYLHRSDIQKRPTQDERPLLTVLGLSISIAGRTILHDANFSLMRNTSLALIGPNGSGKTLLLKAMLGLQPYTGVIGWRPGTRLGYVPQHLSADPHLPLRARELLEAKAMVQNQPRNAVTSVAAWVGCSDLLEHRLGALSGGQFQLVLIAFALIGNPDVLLVDEPTSSLDQHAEQQFLELLKRAQLERGTTVILVSHDLTLVRGFASHVLCLSAGKAFFGTAAQMLVPDILQQVYRRPVEFHLHGMEQRA